MVDGRMNGATAHVCDRLCVGRCAWIGRLKVRDVVHMYYKAKREAINGVQYEGEESMQGWRAKGEDRRMGVLVRYGARPASGTSNV